MKKIFGSHFVYTKGQRNGIFVLIGLIVLLQLGIHTLKRESEHSIDLYSPESRAIQKHLDSLRSEALEKRKSKVFPFNPNYISDYKGYQLGMSVEEIDRLRNYRSQNKFVNSAEEFQDVTQISDSLLNQISPYFKFPEWIRKKEKRKEKRERMTFDHEVRKEKSLITTTDINLATVNDFLTVDGIDQELSERIIKYRTKLQGFSFVEQIYEVWGISNEIGSNILQLFSLQSKPNIIKLNLNTASFKEVLALPYIDYDLCLKIFDYRDEVAELQSISELKNIEGFPMDKYDRIVVYLHSQ